MPSAYVRLTFCKDCSPPPRALEPGARLEHRTRTYVLPGSGDPRPNYIYTQLLPAVVLAWKCDVRACRRECVAYAAWRSVVTIHWSRPVSAKLAVAGMVREEQRGVLCSLEPPQT